MSRPLFLLIKPVSWNCNLRCTYCFYLCKEKIYPQKSICMSDEVLEKLMEDYFSSPQEIYNLCWQGGEPALAGLDFYKKAVELEKKHAAKGSVIANALQTNGTLLNPEWTDFLSRYRFLVGLSLDGPAAFHDLHRTTVNQGKSHHLTMEGLRNLQQSRADASLLALINSDNARRPEEVYEYLKQQGDWLQFTPCVEFDENGNLTDFSVTGRQWGEFLCRTFNLWATQDAGRIHVRHFDAVLEKLLGLPGSLCTMSDSCANYLVVEHNGDLYPCDFYVDEEHKLGNLMETSLMEAAEGEQFVAFGCQKTPQSPVCQSCPYLAYCQGDCPRNRTDRKKSAEHANLPEQADSPSGSQDIRSVLCEGWKLFFSHSLPVFRRMAMQIAMAGRRG